MYMEVKTSIKRVDYIESMNFLEKRVDDVLKDKKDELLWILEHNPIFTSGISSDDGDILDKSINISVWIDSFNSINISGSRLKPSNSISFDRFSGTKFSIISAESDG